MSVRCAHCRLVTFQAATCPRCGTALGAASAASTAPPEVVGTPYRAAAPAPAPVRVASAADAERRRILDTGFCSACAAATTAESTGNLVRVNGFGTTLHGSAAPCAQCGSVQSIKWLTALMVPIIPLGTFRIQFVDASNGNGKRFVSRKAPQMDWSQASAHWRIGGMVAGLVLAAMFLVNAMSPPSSQNPPSSGQQGTYGRVR